MDNTWPIRSGAESTESDSKVSDTSRAFSHMFFGKQKAQPRCSASLAVEAWFRSFLGHTTPQGLGELAVNLAFLTQTTQAQ